MNKSKVFKRSLLLYNTGLYVINFKVNILVINCDVYFFYKKYKNFIKLFILRLKKMRISFLFLNFVQYRLKVLSYSKFIKKRSNIKKIYSNKYYNYYNYNSNNIKKGKKKSKKR